MDAPETVLRFEYQGPHGEDRYYIVHIHEDLLGDVVVTTAWGRCATNHGSRRSHPVAGQSEAQAALTKEVERRVSRGYRLVAQGGRAIGLPAGRAMQ